jgi:hypothetical protein
MLTVFGWSPRSIPATVAGRPLARCVGVDVTVIEPLA